EAAIRTKVFARVFTLCSRDDRKGSCLVRLKVGLKDQHVRFVIIVVVRVDSLRKHFLARTIAHVELHQILFAKRHECSCGKFERFTLAGDIESIDCSDCQLCLLSRAGCAYTCKSKNQKSKRSNLHSGAPQRVDCVTAEDSTTGSC